MIVSAMSTSDKKGYQKINIALIGLLLRGTVIDLFNAVGLGFLNPIANALAIAMFLIGLIELLRSDAKCVIISSLFFSLLWWISILLHPETLVYVKEEGIQFFIYCLPFLWFGHYFVKKAIYLELFLPVARIKLILALFLQLLILLGVSQDIYKGDYQTAANSILVGLVAVFYLALRDKKRLDITMSVLGTIILLIVGSRSSFVAIVFFWVIYLVSIAKSKELSFLIVFVALLVIAFGLDPLLKFTANVAQGIGLTGHLTEALQTGGVFVDEQREELYLGFTALIRQSAWGYGILGDRYISYQHGIFWKPIYPHNIYLEVLVNFGYILGSVIAVIFTIWIIRSLFFVKNRRYRLVVLVLATVSYVKLLFMSSYWIDQMFFMLLGAMLVLAEKDVLIKKNQSI